MLLASLKSMNIIICLSCYKITGECLRYNLIYKANYILCSYSGVLCHRHYSQPHSALKLYRPLLYHISLNIEEPVTSKSLDGVCDRFNKVGRLDKSDPIIGCYYHL